MRNRLAVFLLCATAACGGKSNKGTTPTDATGTDATAIPKVDPTLCDTTGKNVVTYDLNRDNRPDVWRLYKTVDQGGTKVETLTCKQVDFDHDGRKDWVVGYNEKGNPSFEKADLDYDGKFDYSSVFDPKTNQVVEVERDTDFDGTYDVKEIYGADGAIQSVRRDRNKDGKPDLWEQYKGGALIALLYDDDYDGKVDRREDVPGSQPKFVAPPPSSDESSSTMDRPPAGSGSGSGSGSASGSGSGSAKKTP
ncbi:MAG TPA: hypothetical protein VL463_14220 [Kofleriaceae bacterium]|jgi:hypothetical protein|nr:hypothetical protein [Kofleriaceae bacterium]